MDRQERQQVILICLLILGVAYFAWSGLAGFPGVKGFRADAARKNGRSDMPLRLNR